MSELQAHHCMTPEQWTWLFALRVSYRKKWNQLIGNKWLTSAFLDNFGLNWLEWWCAFPLGGTQQQTDQVHVGEPVQKMLAAWRPQTPTQGHWSISQHFYCPLKSGATFSKKGQRTWANATCHNSIVGNFMICHDQLETNLLQLFSHPESSEWFSIISVFIFEVNIAPEQKKV